MVRERLRVPPRADGHLRRCRRGRERHERHGWWERHQRHERHQRVPFRRGLFYLFQGSVLLVQKELKQEFIGFIAIILGILYISYFYYLPPGAKVEAETYLRTGRSSSAGLQPLLG